MREPRITGYYAAWYIPDMGDGCPSTAFRDLEITDEMVEVGARALYAKHLETTTYFRDFEEMRESFEAEARTVLGAALASPSSQLSTSEEDTNA